MSKKIWIFTLLVGVLIGSCKKDKTTTTISEAKVTSLDCSNTTINGILSKDSTEITQGELANNIQLSLDYVGGNGKEYAEISIQSTGVIGLTATASKGTLVNGNGTIKFLINGTPTTDGDALFNVTLGGVSCGFVTKVKKPTVKATMTQNSFTSTSSGTFGYWLYTPKNPTANMPLIVYLHGGSFRGTNLNLLIGGSLPKFLNDSTVKDIPAYILIPQCPTGKVWEQIATPLIEMIDNVVTSKSINTNKISLTGHSLGGTGTWKLGATYSNKFSCIAPLSGSVLASTASQYINIPVYAFVGSADTIVDPNLSINIVPSINSQGGNAQIKIYNGATHFDVPDLTYKDNMVNVLNWIIAQSK